MLFVSSQCCDALVVYRNIFVFRPQEGGKCKQNVRRVLTPTLSCIALTIRESRRVFAFFDVI